MSKQLSQRKMAEALGITHQAVAAAAKKGMPLSSIEEARAWREGRLTAPPATQHGAALDDAYRHAKMRRETAEASIAELKEAEQRGELIRVDAVKSVLASIFATTRESVLQVPSRVSVVIAVESDPTKIHDVLMDELNQALSRLATEEGRMSIGKA